MVHEIDKFESKRSKDIKGKLGRLKKELARTGSLRKYSGSPEKLSIDQKFTRYSTRDYRVTPIAQNNFKLRRKSGSANRSNPSNPPDTISNSSYTRSRQVSQVGSILKGIEQERRKISFSQTHRNSHKSKLEKSSPNFSNKLGSFIENEMESLEDQSPNLKPHEEMIKDLKKSINMNPEAHRVKKHDLEGNPLLLVGVDDDEDEEVPMYERGLFASRNNTEDIFSHYNSQVPASFIHRMTLFEKNFEDQEETRNLEFRQSVVGFLERFSLVPGDSNE